MINVPIKPRTARRLGLHPPLGPCLGVITMPGNVIITPEEYAEFKDRFTKALKGNWQFVYREVDLDERRWGRPWWKREGR